MKKKNQFIKNINDILSNEIYRWIYIDNIKTHYKVSNYGNVVSTDYLGTGKTRLLKPHKREDGYLVVTIYINNVAYPRQIHRLVADAFIPNPTKLPYVNHKDGNKRNNHDENLEWITSKGNSIHAVETGLIKSCEDSYLAKSTNEQIKEVCELLAQNKLTLNQISCKTGIPYDRIYDVLRRKTWKKISRNYDFSKYNKDGRFNSKNNTNVQRLSKT